MPLAKIQPIVYEMTIPGIDKKIQYRQFTSKEYQTLLEAKEFGDDGGFVNTVKQILQDCILSDLDVDSLPMYTADYIFIMIRAKSCGEDVDAEYRCSHIVKAPDPINNNEFLDVPCDAQFRVTLNLTESFIRFPPDYNQKSVIQITDTVGMKLKSPTFEKFRSISLKDKTIFSITDEYIFSCIECIYEKDDVLIPGKDFTMEEFVEWIKDLPAQGIDLITQFFKNQPMLAMDVSITCPKCKNTSIIHLNGLDDFFE